MSLTELRENIIPIADFIQTLDLNNAVAAKELLRKEYPLESLTLIRKLVVKGIQEKWLCPRDGRGLTYGRLIKASDGAQMGIDTVDMTGVASPCEGPGHEHPRGEVDLCFAIEGEPRFDGNPEGWTVYPPKSWHIPTVSRGRMAILYFLPGGSIRFGPKG